MNRVLLTGRLTRDPEMRALASGKHVTTFSVATNEYVGGGREKAEYHAVITWDRLADICAQYLGKGSMVAVEGRLQTRQWEDREGQKRYTTELIAQTVTPLDPRPRDDDGAAGEGSFAPRASRAAAPDDAADSGRPRREATGPAQEPDYTDLDDLPF